ncbi:Hypothetical protein PBC10988_22110 [Planctomycetales bacterium 10988]|nr:Hypothetical protein PBC10988_22110 [Planctomycetales bacterium 10988]
MDEDRYRQASLYLSPAANAFWRWASDGETLIWKHGPTIAFGPEVEAVLNRLAPRGFPPFGVLALFLAACRDNWHVASAGSEYLQEFEQLAEVLAKLHTMDKALRNSPNQKALLAEMVLDWFPTIVSENQARSIALAWKEKLQPESLKPNESFAEGRHLLESDTRMICKLLKTRLQELEEENIRARQKTGLEADLTAPQEELTIPEQVRLLLSQLKGDPDFNDLSQMASQLLAAVTLPKPLRVEQDLPMGGFSDVANRGPLDRLLLSELAYDEDILAARVALKEALYLQREAPPKAPPQQRILLLDNGIRLWGLPRAFATSAALAMLATANHTPEPLAYRPEGDFLKPIDLTSREGLQDALSKLEPHARPTAVFPELVKVAKKHQTADAGELELVLITHQEVIEDHHFRQHIDHLLKELTLYVATVNRKGEFQLVVYRAGGRKRIRTAKLDLERLMQPKPEKAPQRLDDTGKIRYPRIFGSEPFPLCLPTSCSAVRSSWLPGEGLLFATRRRQLMWAEENGYGTQEITARLPRGPITWMRLNRQRQATYVGGYIDRSSQLEVWLIDLEYGRIRQYTTENIGRPVSIWQSSTHLCLRYLEKIEAFRLDGSQHKVHAISREVGPAFDNLWSGRFFNRYGSWHALRVDSEGWKHETVPIDKDYAGFIRSLHDLEGVEGLPSFEGDDGLVAFTGSHLSHILHYQMGGMKPLDTKNAINLEPLNPKCPWELLSRPFQTLAYHRLEHHCVELPLLLLPELKGKFIWRKCAHPTMRNKIKAVVIDQTAGFILQTAGEELEVYSDPQNWELGFRVKPLQRGRTDRTVIPFEQIPTPAEMRVQLQQARLPDGSTCMLDNRGLLHILPADPKVMEMTLTLPSSGPIAIRFEDGQANGPAYFVASQTQTPAEQMYQTFMKWVRKTQC